MLKTKNRDGGSDDMYVSPSGKYHDPSPIEMVGDCRVIGEAIQDTLVGLSSEQSLARGNVEYFVRLQLGEFEAVLDWIKHWSKTAAWDRSVGVKTVDEVPPQTCQGMYAGIRRMRCQ